jgi:S-DNA-T family DNA segregation ATPase FtsK/SpoIIIE
LAVATLLKGAIGELGSGLLLFAAGAFGVFLLAGTDVLTFWRDLRSLLPERYYDFNYDELDYEPFPGPIKTAKEPAGMIELAAAIPAAPVINVPTTEPKSSEKPAAANKDVLVAPGDPMPLPDISQLAHYEGVKLDTSDLEGKARRIEECLASFKVDARVREINPGPAVTQFALQPGAGIKVRRITELQNDLALALAAPSIRIEAPIPGEARVGIEIPNAQVATVGLRETLESSTFVRSKAKLPVPLGRDVNGRYVVGDLTRMPHLLIAGATGSGKSVCLNGIISTFMLTKHPEDLRLLMIDPKMVELTGYNGVPHLQCPVVTEMDKVVGALRLVLREMERRYTLFNRLGVRNIDGYRMKVADEVGAEKLPYLVVIIDELADLMMTAPEEVETLLVRLAQMARATGIHLIIATQRPSVDVLTGLIKANVPARIAFAVTSLTDSRVVLDLPGAERLLGRGDMLFLPPDAAKPQRIQGAFIEDKDVHYIVEHWHKVAPVPHYAQEWLELPSSNAAEDDGEEDPLMEQALEIVRNQGTASASMLQRRLRIGYNRAARLIERMEHDGVIGPADGIKGRPFLAGEG